MHKIAVLFSILLCAALSACSLTFQKRMDPIPKRVDTDIPVDLKKRTYKINVRYFTLSDIGYAKSVDEIESVVTHFDAKEKGNYYRWDDYRVRHFDLNEKEIAIENGSEFNQIHADDNVPWQTIDEGIGFSYFVANTIAENGQLTRLPKVDFARKDIDGFRYYLNLIDFHMWDIYGTVTPKLQQPGHETYQSLEGHTIDILAWENIVSRAEMPNGAIYIKRLETANSEKTQQFYFQQNQGLKMRLLGTIIGNLAFDMPYYGTTRFMGIFEMDNDNRLRRARFNEYLYGKVSAPFFIKVPAYTKREYFVERID